MGKIASHKSARKPSWFDSNRWYQLKEFTMEAFDEFLKRFSINELEDKSPQKKLYWEAKEKGKEKGRGYHATALSGEAIMWELQRAYKGYGLKEKNNDI
jgi:hypothetical protein